MADINAPTVGIAPLAAGQTRINGVVVGSPTPPAAAPTPGAPGPNYDPSTGTGYNPASSGNPVAATSDATRAGIADTGTAINNGLNTNVGNSLLSGFDGSAITNDYNTAKNNATNYQSDLKSQYDQEIAGINTSFDQQATDLTKSQANESGNESASLARMGGYLGDSASGNGAMISMQNLHVQQMQGLEAKRQAALLSAQQAYSDGNYKLAQEQVTESQNYQSQMLAAQKQFADQTVQAATQSKAVQQFALDNNITSPFYSIGGITYSTATGTPVTSQAQYTQLGGKGDMTDVQSLDGNAAAARKQVEALATKYPDAGITPSDSIQAATDKLKASASYQASVKQYTQAKDIMGNPLSFNPADGKYYDMNGNPVSAATTSDGKGLLDTNSVNTYLANKSPDQVTAFNGLSDLQKSDVMQLTNGDVLLSDLMSARGMSGSAAKQQLLMEARSVDPTFSENANKQRYAFKTDWNNPNSSSFKTRTAINTATGHLAELKNDINALNGVNYKIVNGVIQALQKNLDSSQTKAIADFNYVASQLAVELGKAYSGGAPSDADTSKNLSLLNAANPKDVNSSIVDTAAKMLTSLLTSTASEYKNVMGEFPSDQILQSDKLDALQAAGVNTQPMTTALIQQGMHASSIHDYVAAFPDKAATAEKILRENPSLSDDEVLQILQPSFSSVGADTNSGSPSTVKPTGMRTDRNNNPTAMTTDVAKSSGLVLGKDYTQGDPFTGSDGRTYYTAKLIGDPVATTIKAIDQGGFKTASGQDRWSYLADIPEAQNWKQLSYAEKKNIVKQMYQREGGNALTNSFA